MDSNDDLNAYLNQLSKKTKKLQLEEEVSDLSNISESLSPYITSNSHLSISNKAPKKTLPISTKNKNKLDILEQKYFQQKRISISSLDSLSKSLELDNSSEIANENLQTDLHEDAVGETENHVIYELEEESVFLSDDIHYSNSDLPKVYGKIKKSADISEQNFQKETSPFNFHGGSSFYGSTKVKWSPSRKQKSALPTPASSPMLPSSLEQNDDSIVEDIEHSLASGRDERSNIKRGSFQGLKPSRKSTKSTHTIRSKKDFKESKTVQPILAIKGSEHKKSKKYTPISIEASSHSAPHKEKVKKDKSKPTCSKVTKIQSHSRKSSSYSSSVLTSTSKTLPRDKHMSQIAKILIKNRPDLLPLLIKASVSDNLTNVPCESSQMSYPLNVLMPARLPSHRVDEAIKRTIDLTRQFLESQRVLAESFMSTLASSYNYSNMKLTEENIRGKS